MMSKYLLQALPVSIALMLVFTSLSAQKITGIITLQNSGKKPVSGAEIISDGANQVISQTDGKFEVVYANKNIGDNIILKIRKEGYEVVNHKDLYTHLRADGEEQLSVYMCPKGELAVRRIKYYNIQEQYITKRYLEELEKLRKQKKDTWESLRILDDKRRNALRYAKELADHFSIKNLDDCSGRYNAAFALFETGDIVSAINMLAESEGDFLRAQEELNNAGNISGISAQKLKAAKLNRKQAIDCYMLKADLCVSSFRFEDAKKYYLKGVNADTADANNNFKVAFYLQNQNLYSESRFYYDRLIRLADSRHFNEQALAAIFYNLAILNMANFELSFANSNLVKSLNIYQKLLQTDPFGYQVEISSIYSRLGNICRQNKQPVDAKKYLLQAYILREKNATLYPLALAEVIGDLGDLYLEYKQLDSAEFLFKKTLEVIEKSSIEQIMDAKEMRFKVLTDMSDLYIQKLNYEDAEKLCREAIEISEELSRQNPQKFMNDKASGIYLLANIYKSSERYHLAKSTFQKSIDIYSDLAQINPLAYEPFLATALQSWANASMSIGDTLEAIKIYQRALTIYRKLTPNDTILTKPYIVIILKTMALLHALRKDQIQAEKEINEAVMVSEFLVREKAGSYLVELAGIYISAATVMALNPPGSKQIARGKEFLKKAREILNKCGKTPEVKELDEILKELELAYTWI